MTSPVGSRSSRRSPGLAYRSALPDRSRYNDLCNDVADDCRVCLGRTPNPGGLKFCRGQILSVQEHGTHERERSDIRSENRMSYSPAHRRLDHNVGTRFDVVSFTLRVSSFAIPPVYSLLERIYPPSSSGVGPSLQTPYTPGVRYAPFGGLAAVSISVVIRFVDSNKDPSGPKSGRSRDRVGHSRAFVHLFKTRLLTLSRPGSVP